MAPVKVNSIIFHTSRLPELREFYEKLLEFPTGTFEKDGQTKPDYSNDYVNYHLSGVLLCFENAESRTDLGTVVINVPNYSEFKEHLVRRGVKIISENGFFFKIKDPEGRSLIFEPL